MLGLDNILRRMSSTSLNESVTVPVGDKGEIKIYIRNRYDSGRAGNPIRHATSVKVQYGAGKDISIKIPTESYYNDSVDRTIRNSIAQIKSTGISSKRRKFVESFIYDNQAAIVAYWYIEHMTDEMVAAFRKYFNEKAKQNSGFYEKGAVKPKTDAQLNMEKTALTAYMQNALGDPDLTF